MKSTVKKEKVELVFSFTINLRQRFRGRVKIVLWKYEFCVMYLVIPPIQTVSSTLTSLYYGKEQFQDAGI